jgi:hypothetical protein
MLLLDDERWKDLNHRGWVNGRQHELDPDAPYIPDELRALLEDPLDIDRFDNISPYLSSEGSTWEAAFPATPYIVEIAKRLPPSKRASHLITLGFIVVNAGPEYKLDADLEPYLEDFQKALSVAMSLLAETILEEFDSVHTRYLLATAAALKGHTNLADVLQSLDCYTECPECNAEVFELTG